MILMKKLKFIISLLLSFIMTLQVANFTLVYAANDYENHWAKSYIETLLDENIVSGYEDGSVKPDNNISRAEFVTLTNKLFNYSQKADINFADVNSSAWYSDQFLIAKQAGYLTGDDNGYANPEDMITRAESCVIVSKVLNLETVNYTNFSDDNLIPQWAKGYIGAMSKAGLIKGYPDGSFGASKNITRAEAFVIVNNILDKTSLDNNNNNTVSDNKVSANEGDTSETTTVEETETTTVKKITASSGGGGGGGGSSGSKTTTTEATTETTTETTTEVTTETATEITTAPVITPGGGEVSRQEWINSLVTNLGLTRNNDNIVVSNPEDENYTDGTVLENYTTDEILPYSDIENAVYKESIITAYEYGIISAESIEDLFNPDLGATREFAAVTAVKALNFLEVEKDISLWDDYNELKYPIQDAIAVDTGLMPLINNSFKPNTVIDLHLANYILSKVNDINSPVEINNDSEDIIEYSDGVKVLDGVTNYSVSEDGSLITITEYTGNINLTENDVIVLPSNDKYITGYAFVVESTENSNGVVTIKGHCPENILDVVKYIHTEGCGAYNIGEFIPEDGIDVEDYEPLSTFALGRIGTSGTVNGVWSKKFEFNDKKVMNDKGTLNGSLILEIPSIDYKVDIGAGWGGININDLYVVVNSKAQAKGDLAVEYSDNGLTGSEKLKLGTFPVSIAPTLSANINVWLSVDASGKFEVEYTLSNEFGLQVIEKSPRLINNSESNFDVAIEGDLKMGANLGVALHFINWDLVDVATEAGVGAKAKLESHINPTMVCIDGKIYFYWNVSALENSLAGEVFNKTFNKEIFNVNNSPVKKTIHIESREDTNGFVKVPECTYGRGTLNGYVADARDRNNAIGNATATIYNSNGDKVKKLYSDSLGEYSCSLKSGDYILTVTADGYKQFNYSFSIEKDQTTYAETLLLINEQDSGDSICTGKITNSVTGGIVNGVNVSVFENWNNTLSNAIITTISDEYGNYRIELPSGNYTIKFEKEGYLPTSVNVALIAGENVRDYYINPEDSEIIGAGNLRIILTWGDTPRDLDSHLVNTNGLHTYWSYKDEYNSNNELEASLDKDDTRGNGYETTTIYKEDTSAIYSYYVHDYTNRTEGLSKEMSYSNAQVKVLSGEQEIAVFNIPVNREATLWHVFDYDPVTHIITPVHEFSMHSNSGTVGSNLSAFALGRNIEALKDYEITELESEESSETDEETVENTTEIIADNSDALTDVTIADNNELSNLEELSENNNEIISSETTEEITSEQTSEITSSTVIEDVKEFVDDIMQVA